MIWFNGMLFVSTTMLQIKCRQCFYVWYIAASAAGTPDKKTGDVQIERDAATQVTQAAQADLNHMRQDYESQKAEAEPQRAHRKQLRDNHSSLLVRPA